MAGYWKSKNKKLNIFNRNFLAITNGSLKYYYSFYLYVAFFIWFAFAMYWQNINRHSFSVSREQIEMFYQSNSSNNNNNFFAGYFLYFIALTIFNIWRWKFKKDKEPKVIETKDTIFEILPISLEHRVKGKFVSLSLMVASVFLAPYLILIFYKQIHPAMIGERGAIILIMIILIMMLTLETMSKYNNSLKNINKILTGSIVAMILIAAILGCLDSYNLLGNIVISIKVMILDSFVLNVIGNIYVSIFLGVVTAICFYYFNYTYILKGVREHGWKLEKK